MPRLRPRWIAFPALSLALHLIALGVFGSAWHPIPVASTPPPLQWVDLAPPIETRPTPLRSRRETPSPPRQPEVAPSKPVAAMPEPVETPSVATWAAPAPPSRPPGLPLADLLTSARAIGREMAAREAPPPTDADTFAERPILPRLERALRREAAGERHLGDGLIRIVSAGGRVYCLQTPPEFARGGPTASMAVPTNCP